MAADKGVEVMTRNDREGIQFAASEIRLALRNYDDAAGDLLGSNHNLFSTNLKRFIHFIDTDTVFASVLEDQLPEVDFESWYKDAKATVGGMVGSGRLDWPVDKRSRMALQKTLLDQMVAGRDSVTNFCCNFMYSDGSYDSMTSDFIDQIVEPFVRDVRRLVEDVQETLPQEQVSPSDDDAGEQSTTETVRLFICHTSDDVVIVEPLIELLRGALNLSADDIRCTSVDGYRLRGGANTDAELRREVHDCEAFVGVISEASIQSVYVIFELGARWGSQGYLLPLLAPGVPSSILKGPLQGINALRLDNRSQLHQILSDLGGELKLQVESAAAYEKQLDRVLTVAAKEQESQQPSQLTATPTDEHQLSQEEIEIMKIMPGMARGEATVDRIARELGLSHVKTEYYLNDLAREHEFLDWVGNMDPHVPSFYELSHDGQAFLVRNDLV